MDKFCFKLNAFTSSHPASSLSALLNLIMYINKLLVVGLCCSLL